MTLCEQKLLKIKRLIESQLDDRDVVLAVAEVVYGKEAKK